ncbi:unnamed protein product [Haemonchus placei]|uniref:GGACT domain-containing protein n=1 Tax=Haemonchus placei TaxID=6290 RepID=A0A0N4VW84_HAEPC|nr:unnamed protein product [Haemonchus placei]
MEKIFVKELLVLFVHLLVKRQLSISDVLNPSSPKYIGTYVEGNANEGRDLAMYIDDDNEKHVIKGILREIVLNQMDPSKIELFCFGEYT